MITKFYTNQLLTKKLLSFKSYTYVHVTTRIHYYNKQNNTN